MNNLQNVVSIVFLFWSVTAVSEQEHESRTVIKAAHSNSNDDNEKFTWSESDLMNPDEMDPDGDILPDPPTVYGRNGVRDVMKRWPNDDIPYVIEGQYTSDELEMITKAINEIHSKTCVRFIPHTSEPDYVVIESKGRCKSNVGHLGGRQTLYLQPPGCLERIGTVLHEMLHTIGFVHEHSRPERDNYVEIFFRNIQRGAKSEFIKYVPQIINDFGVPYDYESVMHGSQYAGSKNRQIVMKPKNAPDYWGSRIGQREKLSANDILKVNRMYDCFNKRGGPYVNTTAEK